MSSPLRDDSISVVIGSFNAAAWLKTTLESVLSQTHPVDELIVVDDGSTDATAEIAGAYGSRIRFIQEEHRGRPHRNSGIDVSRGAFIAFIDADDYWHPAKLERQLGRMRAQRTEWVVCEAEWLDSATGRTLPAVGMTLREGDILEALFEQNFIVASTPIVSRRVLEAVGGFDESPEVAPVEDWDLWLRIAARYPLACEREPLATLRLHGDSFLASTPLSRRVRSLENVINRASAREPMRLGPLRRIALHNSYYAAGVEAYRQRRGSEARGFFARAWQQRPGDIAALAYAGLSWMPQQTAVRLRKLARQLVHGDRNSWRA